MSRITALRTIRIAERPNLIWAEVETEDGLTGLGESFRGAQAVEAALHELVAPWLLGRAARQIETVSRQLTTPYLGFGSTGAEMRAASAIDLALWDLAGQRHGIPVYEALGGASRTSIRAYNTRAMPTTRPACSGGTWRPAIRRPGRTTIRSPSRVTPGCWPRACCRRASPR